MSPTTIACSAMWPLAWPAVALVAATLFSLLLRGLLLSVLGRWSGSPNGWSSLAQAIRLPSILWSAVFGLWVGIVVANETERLSARLSQPLSFILEVAVILSVTITIANVLSTLIQRVSERKALGRPIAGLGQSVARGIVYCVGLLVLLAALGIEITPILTALGVGGLAVALALRDTLSNLFAGIHLLATSRSAWATSGRLCEARRHGRGPRRGHRVALDPGANAPERRGHHPEQAGGRVDHSGTTRCRSRG